MIKNYITDGEFSALKPGDRFTDLNGEVYQVFEAFPKDWLTANPVREEAVFSSIVCGPFDITHITRVLPKPRNQARREYAERSAAFEAARKETLAYRYEEVQKAAKAVGDAMQAAILKAYDRLKQPRPNFAPGTPTPKREVTAAWIDEAQHLEARGRKFCQPVKHTPDTFEVYLIGCGVKNRVKPKTDIEDAISYLTRTSRTDKHVTSINELLKKSKTEAEVTRLKVELADLVISQLLPKAKKWQPDAYAGTVLASLERRHPLRQYSLFHVVISEELKGYQALAELIGRLQK